MTAMPRSNIAVQTLGKRVSPARPTAATAQVARTNKGSLGSSEPAWRSVSAKHDQLVTPRSISGRFNQRVVTKADSLESVNAGAYLPKMSNGLIHHAVTTTQTSSHITQVFTC